MRAPDNYIFPVRIYRPNGDGNLHFVKEISAKTLTNVKWKRISEELEKGTFGASVYAELRKKDREVKLLDDFNTTLKE